MNGLIFWQNSKNPVLGKISGIFPKTRIIKKNNKKKRYFAPSVFDLKDSLNSCKISEKVYGFF